MGTLWTFNFQIHHIAVLTVVAVLYTISSEKAMAPHSSTLAWKIPRTEEPDGLQSMGSLRVGHDWATSLSLSTFMHWRREWQPTPVFLPGESWGRGEPGGLPSMRLHRVGHDWSNLAGAAASIYLPFKFIPFNNLHIFPPLYSLLITQIWSFTMNLLKKKIPISNSIYHCLTLFTLLPSQSICVVANERISIFLVLKYMYILENFFSHIDMYT